MNECDLTFKLPLYFTGVYIKNVQPLFIPFNMTLKEKFDLVPDFIKNLKYGDVVYIFDTKELRKRNFNNLDIQEGCLILNLYDKDSNFLGSKIISSYCINYTKENKAFCYLENSYGVDYIFIDLKEQDAILEDITKRMKENFKLKNGNN